MTHSPTITVQHLDTGETVAFHGGSFAGARRLVHLTEFIDGTEVELRIGEESIDKTDEAWPLACMLSACLGRGVVVGGTPPQLDSTHDEVFA